MIIKEYSRDDFAFESKVELVYVNSQDSIDVPTGIGYLAAFLDEKHINFTLYTFIPEKQEVVKWVKSKKPKLIAFSCYNWNINLTLDVVRWIKKEDEKIKIVIGGNFTENPKKFLESNRKVDFIHIGRDLENFTNFCKNFFQGNTLFLPSIAHLEGGKYIFVKANEKAAPFDKIPSPYLKGVFSNRRDKTYINYAVTEGCPHNCIFCSWGSNSGIPFKIKPINLIIQELEVLKGDGVTTISSDDGTLNFSEDFLVALSKQIVEHQLFFKWYDIDLRADNFNERIAKALSDMGVVEVGFGLETINEKTQEIIKKKITKDQINSAVMLARKYGFKIHLSIQIGLPFENEDDIKDTYSFVETLDIDEVGAFITRLQEGTELSKNMKKYGLRYEDKNSSNLSTSMHLNYGLAMKWIDKYNSRFNPIQSLRNLLIDGKYVRHRAVTIKGQTTLILYLTSDCNNNCNFCSRVFNKKSDEPLLLDTESIKQVIISGGEPLLIGKQYMIRVIMMINKLFPNASINLNSNGRAFYYPEIAKEIKQLGIIKVRVTLLGKSADEYRKISGVYVGYAQAMKGIQNLLNLGIRVDKKIINHKL